MAPAIPTKEPQRLTKNDTHTWTRTVDGYSADDGYALTYIFASLSTGVGVTVLAVQDGAGAAGWIVTIDTTKTLEFTELGVWLWRAVLTKTGETITIDRGRLEILDPLSGAGDRRLWLERTLGALEAKLEGRASTQQLGYSVDGRSLSLMSFAETLDARDRLKEELQAVLDEEARENGEIRSTAVRVRMWEAS